MPCRRRLTTLVLFFSVLTLTSVVEVIDGQAFERCACGQQNYRAGFEPFEPDAFPSATNSLPYPWVAAIVDRNTTNLLCSAVLVNWREVLTTRHCAFKLDRNNNQGKRADSFFDISGPFDGDIIFGSMNLSQNNSGLRFNLHDNDISYTSTPLPMTYHYPPTTSGSFQDLEFDDELAIIYLSELRNSINPNIPEILADIEIMERYSKYMFPICLRTKPPDTMFDGTTNLMTLGWGEGNVYGLTGPNPGGNIFAYEGSPTGITNLTPCIVPYLRRINLKPNSDKAICVYLNGGKTATCFDDVGGPLQIQDDHFRWHLVGITESSALHPLNVLADRDNTSTSTRFRYCEVTYNPSLFINLHSVKSQNALFGRGSLSSIINDCKNVQLTN